MKDKYVVVSYHERSSGAGNDTSYYLQSIPMSKEDATKRSEEIKANTRVSFTVIRKVLDK